MMTKNERLECKLRAINRANAYAAELSPKLLVAFTPLLGKQVVKKEGGLLEKVKKLLPQLPCTPSLSVYRSTSVYEIAFTVKTCESGVGCCYYHEAVVYVGNLKNGVLTELSKPFQARSDYTVDEVLAKRAAFEAAEKAFRDARSELYPFGERD